MKVRVALAQIELQTDHEANIVKCLTMMEEAASRGAHIICFPEMSFLPFFARIDNGSNPEFFEWAEPVPGPTTERFQAQAKKLGLVTIINLYERASPGEYYDTSPVIDADGKLLGISRMMHIAESRFFHEKFYYRPGNTDYPVFTTRYVKLGIAICYDRLFPEQMRILALKGALIVFSPRAQIDDRLPAPDFAREMIDQVSARLNGLFVVCVSRCCIENRQQFSGGTHVASPKGEILARAGLDEELVIADLDLSQINEARNRYFFLRDRRPETYETLSANRFS